MTLDDSMHSNTRPLILASASPYRRQLLSRLGIDFTVEVADIDESIPVDEPAQQAVLRLSAAKAQAIAELQRGAIVVGSDQVALLGESILGKPHDYEHAIQQLQGCSAKSVDCLTAITVTDGETTEQHIDTTRIRFRNLDRPTIERYLEADKPYDCAGAIRSEGLGVALFESMQTHDPAAIIGLPLIGLTRILRSFGYQLP